MMMNDDHLDIGSIPGYVTSLLKPTSSFVLPFGKLT